jgi:hypothetical protein
LVMTHEVCESCESDKSDQWIMNGESES